MVVSALETLLGSQMAIPQSPSDSIGLLIYP
jgi:hypothetical protein